MESPLLSKHLCPNALAPEVSEFCKSLAVGDKLEFSEPVDLLPPIPKVMYALAQVKAHYPAHVFHERRRDLSKKDQKIAFERDHAIFRDVFMSELVGRTYLEQVNIFWISFFRKTSLIETIQALETIDALTIRNGCDSARCLREEQKSYTRQAFSRTSDAQITVALKMTQVLFFHVILVYGRRVPKGLTYPPMQEHCGSLDVDPDLKMFEKVSKLMEFDDPSVSDDEDYDEDLDAEDACSDASRILPVHPQWFAHNYPLLLTPWFEHVCIWASVECTEDQEFIDKMAAHRLLLTTLIATLKSRLALVNAAQAKLLGCAVTFTFVAVTFLFGKAKTLLIETLLLGDHNFSKNNTSV